MYTIQFGSVTQSCPCTQSELNYYTKHVIDALHQGSGVSLAVQWIRILLLMLGTWVLSMVWEDPMCHRVTKACAPQLLSLHSRGREPQLLRPMPQPAKPVGSEPVLPARQLEADPSSTDCLGYSASSSTSVSFSVNRANNSCYFMREL